MKKFEGMLLASDMDGTLLDSNREISATNLKAIHRFVDGGGRFALSTGRAPGAILEYTDKLPFNAPYSLLNGSLIMDEHHNVLYCSGMPENTKEIIALALEHFPKLCCEIFVRDKIVICQMNEVSQYHMEMLHLNYSLASQDELGATHDWCKINFTGFPPLIEELKEFLNPYRDKFSMATSLPTFWEVTASGVHKGSALKWIAEKCSIDPEKVFAIGDSCNDETMLKTAHLSFAPANSDECILDIADVKVSSNNENAVAEAIDYLEK